MKKIISFIVFILVSFIGGTLEPVMGEEQISVSILYDNTVFKQGTLADWGFACLIEGTEKTILFDTGTNGKILMNNIDILGIDPDNIDLIAISHNHPDHTGGLDSVLGRKSEVSVYLGASFFTDFIRIISSYGAKSVKVDEPVKICEHVYSTGELHGDVNEQSLVLDTEKGLVIITGCAHTGIVNILKKAKEILNKNIYLVLGGFHLLEYSDTEINQIIEEFKTLGVEKCGATHCTGDRAIALFKNAYGENYIPMGVGNVIKFPKLTTSTKGQNKEESKIPNIYKLGQNYPNPFNPATTICYSVPKTSFITIKVFDILGREILTLVNEEKSAGKYSIRLSASNYRISSGIYFCRMQAGSFKATKKLLLLK